MLESDAPVVASFSVSEAPGKSTPADETIAHTKTKLKQKRLPQIRLRKNEYRIKMQVRPAH